MSLAPNPAVQASILAAGAGESARHEWKTLMEIPGCEVVDAATRVETLRIARAARPAAILLGARLADGDVLAVCRELKSDPQTAPIPVLILSPASADNYTEAVQAGADAWLREPVEPFALRETVRALLMRPQPLRTARNEAGEPLSEIDRRWRALVEAVPAILCSNRADGTCAYCNGRAYEYTGMPVGSLEGFDWLELIHPEDRPRIREAWLAGIRAGDPFVAEYRLRRADGEFRWFHSHVIPVVDPHSGGMEWFGVSTEIHELKALREKAEDALRESEARFRSLFENATVGLYRTTPEGRILMANPALISLLGFGSFEELARRNLEDEGAGPGYSRAAFRRQIESEGVVRGVEATWTRRDGTPVFIRESARVVRGPDGAILFYDGIIEDFTRRKQAEDALRQSEEQFHAIFDQASVGIVHASLDGQFQAVNDRVCEITGYSRAELLSMNYRDLTHPDDLDMNLVYARRLLSGELRSFHFEKRYVRKDGSTIWVNKFVSRVTQQGSPDSVVGVMEDISERKRAEQELRRQLEFDRVAANLLMRFATHTGAEIDQSIVDSLRAVAEHCGADHAFVLLRTGEDGAAHCTHEWCAPHVMPQISRMQSIRAEVFPWSARHALANREVAIHEADDLRPGASAEPALLEQEGAKATLQVPIEGFNGSAKAVIGCIVLHRQRESPDWTDSDLTRVRMMGNAIAAVLDRKRAEEFLRQSEEKFSLVFHASPEVIVITSVADRKLTDVNPRFTEITGYSREETIGKTTEELRLFVNEADRRRVWSSLLERHALLDCDMAFRTKSGAARNGLLSSVLVSVQGRPYFISMFRDLTERRHAEEAVRRQAAFDNLMTGMLSEFVRSPLSDFGGVVERALAGIAAFFAAHHAMLLEVSAETNTWCMTHEWCAPHVSPITGGHKGNCIWSPDKLFSDTDAIIDLAGPGPHDGYDLEAYREEGATFVINVPIKGAAGIVTGRIGLHRHGDRTAWTPDDAARLRMVGNAIGGALERARAYEALRESEERFRDLANSVPAVMWIGGGDGNLVFCNKYGLERAGLPEDRLLGDGWSQLLHPDDRERYLATWSAALNAHAPFSAEMRMRHANGEYRWMLNTAVPRFVGGAYLGHIGFGLDITDLKHSYEQHLASQKLESLGVLAAGVAHDFNNLLGAIVARAESAQSDLESDSPATEDVEQIHLTALRAAEIVSQLMTFARQESAPSTTVDLSSLVAEMLDLLRVSLAKTAILKTDLARDLPAIHANAAEMRQVVMNLIINASEALAGKPGSISITTARAPLDAESGAAVRLEVKDTGGGMTADVRARIFDPFFSTRFAGRGLGLSAVLGIVRRHGGSIEVESQPGQGSRFTILLPV